MCRYKSASIASIIILTKKADKFVSLFIVVSIILLTGPACLPQELVFANVKRTTKVPKAIKCK